METSAKKVLIIEDEAPLLKLLSEKFTQQGFNVETAADGAQGLVAALKSHPDIILLDIIMPKMDGLTMLKQLRADPWGKEADVLILTNKEDSDSISEAMEEHVGHFIVKADWNVDALVDLVKTRLEVMERAPKP